MSERQYKINNQLDEFLGIKESENVPAVEEKKEIVKKEDLSYDGELNKSLDELEHLSNLGSQAFENAVEQYSAYGKDRTIDVSASLLKSLVSLKAEKRETLKDLYRKDDNNDNGTKINNVNIYTEDIKDILKTIPEQKVVVVERQDNNNEENIMYDVFLKKEHDNKLNDIDIVNYTKTINKDVVKLTFLNPSDYNKFKFRFIEKFGNDILQYK